MGVYCDRCTNSAFLSTIAWVMQLALPPTWNLPTQIDRPGQISPMYNTPGYEHMNRFREKHRARFAVLYLSGQQCIACEVEAKRGDKSRVGYDRDRHGLVF